MAHVEKPFIDSHCNYINSTLYSQKLLNAREVKQPLKNPIDASKELESTKLLSKDPIGGLALKPGVVQQVQSCVGQAMEKMMTNLGFIPGLSAVRSVVPRFVHSSTHAGNGSSVGDIETTFGDFTHLASGSAFSDPTRNGSSTTESTHESLGWKTSSETSIASHSEKVINSFLQNPVLKNEEETKLNELAGSLRSENNVLQMVLKHQQVIEELFEQNEKLRGILVDELKVSPSKLETRTRSWTKLNNPCSDCFECRRKRTTR